MHRPLAPDGETVGARTMKAGELQHVVDVLPGIEIADDVGPLARRRHRDSAGARAVGQAFDRLDVRFARLLLQRREETRAGARLGGITLAAASDANEQSRHTILLSFGGSPRQ